MSRRERLGAAIHAVHGSRGLGIAVVAMFVLTIVEPVIPSGAARAMVTIPVFALGLTGLLTLPREGVAVQLRLRRLVQDAGAGRELAKALVFPFLLMVLLMPQSFLAAYGVPHFSPLTGLVLASFQRRVATAFLFGLLLLPIIHLRRTRRYAPDVTAQRPMVLADQDPIHHRRDVLVVLVLAVVLVWAALLWPFWKPFSLFAWPPSLQSFTVGIRGVAALAYSVFLPALLFIHLAAHAHGIRYLVAHAAWRTHWHRFTLLWIHVALGLVAAGLHIYNLLWIVRYQSLVGF